MTNILVFDDIAKVLEDMADKYDCQVAQIIEAIFDEMNYNDEEWKDHLDI